LLFNLSVYEKNVASKWQWGCFWKVVLSSALKSLDIKKETCHEDHEYDRSPGPFVVGCMLARRSAG
jgi:hypothetical protein